ncbi:uncharacterized protein PITG_05016 [Phytophthora infestans T30-4]|uniref:Uncharacterized protein n=1 Tax=Phytophthora infestans (strain T30-4) TaxID=403677 RepID=D0N2K9_PHYIT|nr:uncharacterized protein PITG_05016 [Phytophthora infestans T30-4]EEY68538.1 conserved hypothetical protein [Phytophthora infestans T30-4]|eukprot:XP_002905697.1 conserved hypothetical protein [Phytophthora infestans T30-4]
MPVGQLRHLIELEEDEDHPKKNRTPLPYYCAALEKRWEAFETQSTSHTVGMNLLEKLASMRADEEMEEPVAKDVVMHLVESGHLLLHQRFRAAFVERWVAAEVIGLSDGDENGIISGRLRALQSCMDLVHLLRYKREFVFDQDDCSVAKMYIEHTVLSMDAGTGADARGIKQQVAANFEPLRLEVASEFYKEYAVHLRTLGFRRLRTLATSRSHARAFPADPSAANESDIPAKEGFSEYFYHPWLDASHDFHDAENGHGHSVGKHQSEDDAFVVTPPLPWKKAATFQNIGKGLQCFLQAFPDPPMEPKKFIVAKFKPGCKNYDLHHVLWINDNQIQELDGLDGCFRLKQINAHNNCIRSNIPSNTSISSLT